MNTRTIALIAALVVAVGVIALSFTFVGDGEDRVARSVSNFEECAAAGYPIMYSYPPQCRANGETFVEDVGTSTLFSTGNELEKTDLIRISTPRPNQRVESPLVIEGEARGFWFFEASFPVRLYDKEGNELAVSIATAGDEWMTEEFVPFASTMEFEAPVSKTGTLVLEKDNPSGLPEHADALIVPVRFSD